MCTVSWIFHRGGYELFCNRDETRRRARAVPPRRHEQDAVAYLAPEDGDAGGTWIAVNELGLALCLLNRYPEPADGVYRSRGLLVTDLAGSATTDEVTARLARMATAGAPRYRPFTLLVLEPEGPGTVTAWDGHELLPCPWPVQPPLSSSSYAPEEIGEVRRRLWREAVVDAPSAQVLEAFHRSHEPGRGPLSPCMHRDDARTVSFTRVRVRRSAVEMAYADGPPCRAEVAHPLTLMRRVARSPALRHVAPVV